jgi:hypothetical protein
MENIKLAYKLAWSFHFTTGIESEELISEATFHYLKAEATYDEERKRSNTTKSQYLYSCIYHGLIDFCKQQNQLPKHHEKQDKVDCYSTNPTPFFELYDSFPKHCKVLADIVLQNPIKFAQLPPKEARGLAVKIMRKRGIAWSQVWDSIRDLKTILNETEENCIIITKNN